MTIAPSQTELAAMNASASDPQIARAGEAMQAGDIATAEANLRSVLNRRPDDFVALRMLGEIAASVGFFNDAEGFFRRALSLAPGFQYARLHLALALHEQNRSGEALSELDQVGGELAGYEETKAFRAEVLGRVGEYEEAIRLYREALEADGADLEWWIRLGFLLKTVGRVDEAIEACRAALEIRPEYGEAWWLLADMKTYDFSEADVAALTAALESPGLEADDRLRLHFTLGKALEDRKDLARSFDHYRQGNAIRSNQLRYDPDALTRFVERTESLFTADFLKAHADSGDSAADPIFILGMPRSGSTLVEQILASHSMIEGTSELSDIAVLAQSLEPDPRAALGATPYPELLADLSDERLRELGALYLERTRIQRKTSRPLFIDKMPNNWIHAGFIQLILPKAKIVDVRRHPLACGFSNFKQLYSRGQEFSYDLRHFGSHYANYARLMAHFDRVAPGRIHRVIHEQLVTDAETEVRRLLDYVGVPFEEACLRFYDNARPVRTPSAEQVRKPLSADRLNEWRAYEKELAPLKDALGATMESWDRT